MKNSYRYINILVLTCIYNIVYGQAPINRRQLVERHHVVNLNIDTLSALTVGNGNFAFTADVTGLQSFPEVYAMEFRWERSRGGAGIALRIRWGIDWKIVIRHIG